MVHIALDNITITRLFTFGRVRYVGVQRLAVLIVRVTAVVHAQRTQAQIMIYRQKQMHV